MVWDQFACRPPKFWFWLSLAELYRHQEAVRAHLAQAKDPRDKEFYAVVLLDISIVIVLKGLDLKV